MFPHAALIVLAMQAAAGAQAPASTPPAAPVEVKKNPLDKVICRTEDTIGTRLGAHKVCATLREWKDQEEDNRQALEKIQQGQGVVPSG